MNSWFGARAAAVAVIAMAVPGVAFAQVGWAPGSEIVGQPIQVTTNGVTNTVYLDQGGAARIDDPGRQYRPGHVERGQWPAVPQQRQRAGMLCPTTARSRPASR